MIWVEVFLVFIGIPATMFVVITFVVMRLTRSRVPDGIAARRAAEPQARQGAASASESQRPSAVGDGSAEEVSSSEGGPETSGMPDTGGGE